MYGIGNKNLTHTICVPPHMFVGERVKLLILGKSRCVCMCGADCCIIMMASRAPTSASIIEPVSDSTDPGLLLIM